MRRCRAHGAAGAACTTRRSPGPGSLSRAAPAQVGPMSQPIHSSRRGFLGATGSAFAALLASGCVLRNALRWGRRGQLVWAAAA